MGTTTTHGTTVGEERTTVADEPAELRLRRRLRPLQMAVLLQGVALWVPVEKLFMKEIGFDPAKVGLLAASYAAAVPLLEIPSGILADRWSRKGTLMIAHVAMLVSVLLGGLATSVGTYLLSALVLGVYFAMQSGTLEAVVYDAVVEETGISDRFERLLGRVRLAESMALVAGALAGGVLAAVTSPRLTYFLTLPFIAASIVVLARFREPRLHRAEAEASLRTHIALTYRTITQRGRLLPLITVMVLTAVLTQALVEFGPLWLVALAAPAFLFGPQFAGIASALGLGGVVAGRLRLDRPVPLAAVIGVMLASSLTLTVGHAALVVIVAQVVLAMLVVAAGVFLTHRLHDAVPSSIRTGVASGVSTFTWVVFLPFGLGFGELSQRAGVHAAGWMIVATTALAGLLLAKVALCPGPVDPAALADDADSSSDAPFAWCTPPQPTAPDLTPALV
jgi:MFS family permease